MTDEHKAALAEGRAQGRAVRLYLEALEANKPKRGRKRTPDSIKKRLVAVASELEAGSTAVDITALEKGFISAASGYASRKGISYSAFRSVGVPPAVLRAAGITRAV